MPEEIKHVLSLYKWEHYTIGHQVGRLLTVEMYDSLDQTLEGIDELARWVNSARADGPTLVHCQAGLNRSSLVIARALMLSGEAESGREAIDVMRSQRSPAVLCNPTFEAWILSFDEADNGQ